MEHLCIRDRWGKISLYHILRGPYDNDLTFICTIPDANIADAIFGNLNGIFDGPWDMTNANTNRMRLRIIASSENSATEFKFDLLGEWVEGPNAGNCITVARGLDRDAVRLLTDTKDSNIVLSEGLELEYRKFITDKKIEDLLDQLHLANLRKAELEECLALYKLEKSLKMVEVQV